MEKTQIKAEIVADSVNEQGDRLTSLLITFPRIILAEVNTHRMLSKNTSSSRAIPFKKMVESVQNDPFIPLAWQKHHSGMQGTEYFTEIEDVIPFISKNGTQLYANKPLEVIHNEWLRARDKSVECATHLNNIGVTKQLCNRLLEPFMWTTMLITGSKEGWDNFFELRCPNYTWIGNTKNNGFKSRKEMCKAWKDNNLTGLPRQDLTLDWLKLNEGQAEIHIMDLAEKIYDVMNESKPQQLKAGEWHIPFRDKIDLLGIPSVIKTTSKKDLFSHIPVYVKISTAMSARTSYTVVGDEKEINSERMIGLHDRLLAQDPPHSSPMEHCARAMNDEEYYLFCKGQDGQADHQHGWCRNYRGFIQYRHIIETKKQ